MIKYNIYSKHQYFASIVHFFDQTDTKLMDIKKYKWMRNEQYTYDF